MSHRKLLAGLAVVAALGAGATIGLFLGVPTLSGAQTPTPFSTFARWGWSGSRMAACQKLESPGGTYRSRVCGEKSSRSGRIILLAGTSNSARHAWSTAIPEPTLRSDIARYSTPSTDSMLARPPSMCAQ